VVDLLLAMCRAALLSSRKSIIFEPYPSVVDPSDPKTLAFNPKRKSYDRLQSALDSVLLIRKMAQGPYSEIKKQMDRIDPLAHPLLQWIIASNRSHIVKLPLSRVREQSAQLKFMHTPHQFLLISSPPAKEARFQAARKLYGSTFAFHGSHIENWHSILRNGLVTASYTKLQEHPGRARFLQSRNLNCIALCEVITSKDLRKHGNIWVNPISDYVCTRFLFVYENGQVGDVNINTQDAKIHREIIQIMKYTEQRIPTLNEHCAVCDERHVFQNHPMLKPTVCTRELCVFSFYTLGVMSEATEEVATGAEVVDLLLAMCRAALLSSRKSIIFEPYPSVVDPSDPKTLAFNPKRKSYDRLQSALDSVLLIRKMAQGPYSEIKKQMDRIDPLAHPLLQWIIASNRSHIVKLPLSRQLKFMHTPHQFLLISSPPAKEARFQAARKLYGSTFAFHGSHIENWHSILRNGLVTASYTKLQLHGAAYGKGIYLSPISSVSFGYSEMGNGQHQIPTKEELIKKYDRINTIEQEHPGRARFLQSRNLNCIALCEVITSKDLRKHGNIWVNPISDYVCTRFLFVYENGQVGDVNINTQDAKIHREIIQVMATKSC
ncbi:protein mono-ADP-ribosyltransferase PARP6-like, partial [Diretmus argenteus]